MYIVQFLHFKSPKVKFKQKKQVAVEHIFTAQAAVAGSYLSQRSFGDTGFIV